LIGSHFIRFSTWTCRPGLISISSPLPEDAADERTSDDAALHVPPAAAGLIDIKRSRDKQHRVDIRVAGRLRDDRIKGLDQGADIDSLLCRDRDDGRILGYSALNEPLYLFIVLQCLSLGDTSILFWTITIFLMPISSERHQVFLGLGLGTGLVCSDDKHRPIHQRGAGEHRRHQCLVARGIDE